jgi:hypothetical protein
MRTKFCCVAMMPERAVAVQQAHFGGPFHLGISLGQKREIFGLGPRLWWSEKILRIFPSLVSSISRPLLEFLG